MYPFTEVQSTASTLFQAYASWAASVMLIRSMANELIPTPVRSYIQSAINYLFTPLANQITIVIDEQSGMSRNQVYDSAEIYLSKKISPSTERFKVNKTPKQKTINVSMEKNQEITDRFGDIQLKWRFVFVESQQDRGYTPEKRFFELSFNKKHKDAVLNDYLPFVLDRAKQIRDNERVVKLYTRDCPYTDDDYNGGGGGNWGAINLDHPATFDTLAMNPDAKRAIIEDLDRFVRRREYYKTVGKAWKRGYLLYGPPGTGKSTLVAAMANYLKFDIYDLELTSLYSNSELRRILVSTTNRSIIVIEDIDCSVEMHDRQLGHDSENNNSNKLTLSGLLNFIDGLWSSCGDERIVVFTTNYKEKLDPALLRPGRMDMHIHMSYCTPQGFKILALNYHGIREHSRFGEIENLIENVEVTPAEVAEELMRSEAAEAALQGVVNFLRRKRSERNEDKDEKRPEAQKDDAGPMETDIQEAKRLKLTDPSEVKDEKCPTPEEKEDASPTEAANQEVKRLKTEEILRRTLRSVRPRAKPRYKRGGRVGFRIRGRWI